MLPQDEVNQQQLIAAPLAPPMPVEVSPPVQQLQAPQAGLDALSNVGTGLSGAVPVATSPAATPETAGTNAPIGGTAVPPSAVPAVDAAHESAQGTVRAQEQVGEAKKTAGQTEAASLDAKVAQQHKDAQEQQDMEDAHRRAVSDAGADVRNAEDEVKNFKFHDHWQGKSIASKVLQTIFSGFGGIAEARGLGPNQITAALDAMDAKEQHNQEIGLKTKENLLKWRKEGETDLLSRLDQETGKLKVKQAARLDMMANEAKAQALRQPGTTPDQAENNVLVHKLREKADQIRSEAEVKLYEARAKAEAAKIKAKKTGAGGGVAAGGKLADAVEAIRGGAGLAQVIRDHKLTPKEATQAQAMASKEGAPEAKADAAKLKADEHLAELGVRDGDGNLMGYASSSRNVKAIQDRAIQYDDSIAALEDLKKNLGLGLPIGDRVARANIAIAATTTANSSDHTNATEANTIKNYGLNSKDAIERTLEHLKKRQSAFAKQLRPVEKTQAAPSASAPANQSPVAVGSKSSSKGVPIIWNGTRWIRDSETLKL